MTSFVEDHLHNIYTCIWLFELFYFSLLTCIWWQSIYGAWCSVISCCRCNLVTAAKFTAIWTSRRPIKHNLCCIVFSDPTSMERDVYVVPYYLVIAEIYKTYILIEHFTDCLYVFGRVFQPVFVCTIIWGHLTKGYAIHTKDARFFCATATANENLVSNIMVWLSAHDHILAYHGTSIHTASSVFFCLGVNALSRTKRDGKNARLWSE